MKKNKETTEQRTERLIKKYGIFKGEIKRLVIMQASDEEIHEVIEKKLLSFLNKGVK